MMMMMMTKAKLILSAVAVCCFYCLMCAVNSIYIIYFSSETISFLGALFYSSFVLAHDFSRKFSCFSLTIQNCSRLLYYYYITLVFTHFFFLNRQELLF